MIQFGDTWSKSNLTWGSSSPFLCVKASGGFTLDCNLCCSSPYPSLFMRPQTQRVGLLVNLWCDKACNLIVAPFPLCSQTFTPLCQRTTFHGCTIPSDSPGRRLKKKKKIRAEGQCAVILWVLRLIRVCVRLKGVKADR